MDTPAPPELRTGDDVALAMLRRRAHEAGLGVDWSRADEHAVVDFVAWAAPLDAPSGPTLQNLAPKPTAAAAAPAPAASAARPRQAAAASPPPATQSTLGPDVDAAATAQNLRDAANDGVPFCEECARAAAAS
jgi:hypothetical protein